MGRRKSPRSTDPLNHTRARPRRESIDKTARRSAAAPIPQPPPAPKPAPEPISVLPPVATARTRRGLQVVLCAVSPTRVLPVLLGLGAAWQCLGMSRVVAPSIEPSASAEPIFAVAVLLACVLGPHLPEGLATLVISILRGLRRGPRITPAGASQRLDDELLRSALAAISGLAGLFGLLQLPLAVLGLRIDASLRSHYHWMPLTWTLSRGFAILALLALGAALFSMALIMLSRLRARSARPADTPRSVLVETLLGFALGFGAGERLLIGGFSAQQLCLAGTLPFFIMVLLTLTWRDVPRQAVPPTEFPDDRAPNVSQAGERLIIAMLLLWSLALAAFWCAHHQLDESLLTRGGGFEALLATTAIAAAATRWLIRARESTVCDTAIALWIASLLWGAAPVLRLSPLDSQLPVLVAGVGFGLALAFLEQAWFSRAGAERSAFAQFTAVLAAGGAIGVATGHWWALPILGLPGTLMIAALAPVTAAGLVLIYATDRPGWVRQLVLAAIFISLAVSMLIFPAQARRWTQGRRDHARAFASFELDAGLVDLLRQSSRVCWIAPQVPVLAGDLKPRELRHLAPPVAEFSGTADAAEPIQLIYEHRSYDLIYQCWPLTANHLPQFTIEWFRQLLRTGKAGRVVIDIPLAGESHSLGETIAATFQSATSRSVAVERVTGPFGPAMRLTCPAPKADRSTALPVFATPRPHAMTRDALSRLR